MDRTGVCPGILTAHTRVVVPVKGGHEGSVSVRSVFPGVRTGLSFQAKNVDIPCPKPRKVVGGACLRRHLPDWGAVVGLGTTHRAVLLAKKNKQNIASPQYNGT